MRRYLLVLSASWSVATTCWGGSFPFDPLTIPTLIVHERGTGSGCFIQASNSVYLFTAKHVLFAEPAGTNPPALLSQRAFARTYAVTGETNASERVFNLDLAQLLSSGNIRYSTNRDVVLARVEDCNPTNRALAQLLPGFTCVTPAGSLDAYPQDVIACPFKDVDVGADVYMFGYPTSLTTAISGFFDASQPLLRKGIVAGVNRSGRTIIVDSPAYQGNSGGPVVQVGHPAFNVTTFKIIGLVSRFVPFQEEWENKTLRYSHTILSNSGYTIIEPIDMALELVWK
jgi:hypothetical protein